MDIFENGRTIGTVQIHKEGLDFVGNEGLHSGLVEAVLFLDLQIADVLKRQADNGHDRSVQQNNQNGFQVHSAGHGVIDSGVEIGAEEDHVDDKRCCHGEQADSAVLCGVGAPFCVVIRVADVTHIVGQGLFLL